MDTINASAVQETLQDAFAIAASDGSVGGYEINLDFLETFNEPVVGKLWLNFVENIDAGFGPCVILGYFCDDIMILCL